MGINLTGQTIASTYEDLVLISGSVLSNGTGSDITSLTITASNAISASAAVSASHALIADDALTATSASYALSASHAENADTATSASHALIADNAVSASYALTSTSASHALDADTSTSASHALNADNAISSSYAVNAGSALTATSASHALNADASISASHALVADFALNASTGSALITASISDATTTFTKGDGSTFALTVNNVVNASSASVAVSASHAENADDAITALTAISASHALNSDVSISSSFADTSISSSYSNFALSASYALNAQAFPFTGSAQITGSVGVTGSLEVLGTPALHYRLISKNGINACDGGSIAQDASNGGDGSIVGGQNNIISAQAQRGVIIGGNLNQLTGGPDSVSIGGRNTNASGLSVVIGGFNSTILGARTHTFGCVDVNLTGMSNSTNYLTLIGARGGFKPTTVAITLPEVVLGGYANSGSSDGRGNTLVGGINNHISGSISGSSMIGGEFNTLSHTRSVIIGGTGITSSAADTVYVPNLYVSGSLTAPSLTVASASYADTASVALTADTATSASYALVSDTATSASHALASNTSISASHALNADNAVSSSYALTASFLEGGIPTVEAIWTSYTGSNNLFANTASFNYTIGQGYATSSQIENSMFSAINSQVGSARNSAIIGGTGHEMYDNTGGFGGVIVENSIILGGTSNGIFGDANGAFILGGNNNQVEADDTNNSGIIGGNNNVAYAVDNTVVIGGSSNLLRSTSDNTVAVGSTSNTLDFTSKTALLNSHNNSNGTTNTNVTLISTDGATAFQDYNVYIGVNGAGRTFEAGTATTVNTYIDKLIVSSSVSASSFIGDGSGLTNIPAGNPFPHTGSAEITGSLIVTGSISGEVQTLSVSSNTASIDCSVGNFFKLTIPGASTTQVVASNIQPGQTINVLFEQEANNSGSITFPSYFKFAGGYDYEPTLQSGSKDIVSMVAFDSTNLYTVSVKNLL